MDIGEFLKPLPTEDGSPPEYYTWDHDAWYNSLSPSRKRQVDRRLFVIDIYAWISKNLPWINWPIINIATVFWTSLADEGPKEVFGKYGSMSFAFLNDGMKPTLWHTYMQIFHRNCSEYSNIWVGGAPKNRLDAEEKSKAFIKDSGA
jgi:hypothetical protein